MELCFHHQGEGTALHLRWASYMFSAERTEVTWLDSNAGICIKIIHGLAYTANFLQYIFLTIRTNMILP